MCCFRDISIYNGVYKNKRNECICIKRDNEIVIKVFK